MVSRRSALSLLATAVVGSVAGTRVTRPTVRLRTGTTSLHPAANRVLAGGVGLEAGDDHALTVAPANATDLAGPDATTAIADALQGVERESDDRLTVVTQLRSTPESPKRLDVTDVGWRFPRTLELTASAADWGSLSDLEDDAEGERLRSANEVVETGVWRLSPRPRFPPSRAVLSLE